MKTCSSWSFLQRTEAVDWQTKEINRSLFGLWNFCCYSCAKFALLHFDVRRLSRHSHELLSCISNTYAEWCESLCLDSQPLRLDLLLGFMVESKYVCHMKNSEQTVTISSAATTVKYHRYLTQEDVLLLHANCWLRWILCLFCSEQNTIFVVKEAVRVCLFTWGVCKRKTTLLLHIRGRERGN